MKPAKAFAAIESLLREVRAVCPKAFPFQVVAAKKVAAP